MRKEPEKDLFERELFLAGERVPSGRYKNLDSPRVLVLDYEDVLPAAMDGRVTCYTRLQSWRDMQPLDVSSVPDPKGKR